LADLQRTARRRQLLQAARRQTLQQAAYRATEQRRREQRLREYRQRLGQQAEAALLPALRNAGRNLRVEITPEYEMLGTWRFDRQQLIDAPRELLQNVGQAFYDKCLEYSATQYFSLQELAEMGHPYSIRHQSGAAGIPDYLINLQTGNFLAGWQMQVSQEGSTSIVEVANRSSVAGYLMGKDRPRSRMRRRPLMEAAYQNTQAERETAIRTAQARVRELLRQGFRSAGGARWRDPRGRFTRMGT
jgi:hypothetical protein